MLKSPFSVGEKLRYIRQSMSVSQQELSEVAGMGLANIVRAERAEYDYTPAQLEAITKHLGIEGMPLTEYERATFKERLYHWRRCIRDDKLDEARVMRKEMANIVKLDPCDDYLSMLYRIVDIHLTIYEGDLKAAEERLEQHKDSFVKAGTEHRYYYNDFMSYISILNMKLECAAKFCKAAIEIGENSEDFVPDRLEIAYGHLAMLYTSLELPHEAIQTLLIAKHKCRKSESFEFDLTTDSLLAHNYIHVGKLKEAKKILEQGLLKAEGARSNYIGHILRNFGLLYQKVNEWRKASQYFSQSQKHLKKGTDGYYVACCHEIQCLIESKAFKKAAELIEQIIPECITSELWPTYFEALSHYLVIRRRLSVANYESIDYILNTAIPHLLKYHSYFLAVDYYKLLHLHYIGTRSYTNALLMNENILRIYERCLFAPKEEHQL